MPPTERLDDADGPGAKDPGVLRTVQRFLAFLARDPWWAFVLVCVESLLHLSFRWRLIGVKHIPESGRW
jgi:1-acyl-sn-glycerol-3-phosphate acyltransferase